MRSRTLLRPGLVAGLLAFVAPAVGFATSLQSASGARTVRALEEIGSIVVDAPSTASLLAEDALAPLEERPERFALARPVSAAPAVDGTWEDLGDGRLLWRLRVRAPDAHSLNLGFSRYRMPSSGRLSIYASDRSKAIRPFTASDNRAHGQLWTPPLETDDLVVEVSLDSSDQASLELELTSVGYGYRPIGKALDVGGDPNACQVDVACSEADDWRDPIRAVAVYSLGGSTFCAGTLINNTSADFTPLFLTAEHCKVDASNAASLVAFWNFDNSTCRAIGSPENIGPGDGVLDEFVTGSTFLASSTLSDFTLVRLDTAPLAFDTYYAGWDRSLADPPSAVVIHHSNSDEKRITFENDPTTTTSAFDSEIPGDGNFIRVADWDMGSVTPGASGSPLLNPEQRVVGQVRGGQAKCGNDLSTWFGRISASWTGGGTPDSRLSDWLDPTSTGAIAVDGLDASGLSNDDFAARFTLGGQTGQTQGNNTLATGEAFEPQHAGVAGPLQSVWWEWVAEQSGEVTFDTLGSDFDTTLAVYTGSALDALTEIVSNDDISGQNPQSEVVFTASVGVSYKIAVAGSGGSTGDIVLSWNRDLFPEGGCSVDLNLSYAPGNLGLDLTVETHESTSWTTWLVAQSQVSSLWSSLIPVPVASTEALVELPVPPSGVIGVLTLFNAWDKFDQLPTSEVLCFDFAFVFTGFPGR